MNRLEAEKLFSHSVQFRLGSAAMLPASRTVSICLALLCGTTCLLCAQTAPVLTPGSVVYLKERIAVKTKTGIIGLDPGAGVRLVSENGNAVSVTDGTTTFDVSKEKLIANIDEANVAAQNVLTEQAAAQAFNAEVARREQERKLALEQQRLAAERQARVDAEQQKKAEAQRHAQFEAQAAVQRQQLANRQAAKTEEYREQEIRALRTEVNAARIEAARARQEAQAATLNGPEINRPHH